jgi:hypothetical protein
VPGGFSHQKKLKKQPLIHLMRAADGAFIGTVNRAANTQTKEPAMTMTTARRTEIATGILNTLRTMDRARPATIAEKIGAPREAVQEMIDEMLADALLREIWPAAGSPYYAIEKW